MNGYKKSFKFLIKSILDFILPNKCLLCSNFSDNLVCENCLHAVDFKLELVDLESPYFEAVYSLTEYKNHIKTILKHIKFNGYKSLSEVLSAKIMAVSNLLSLDINVVTAIPIHKSRLKKRGFNQVEVLFAPLLTNTKPCLKRTKNTPPLFNLAKEQREKILCEAFEVNPETEIKDKNILLLDDICTSGSTLNEAARILKNHGANKLYALTLCYVKSHAK